MDIEPEVVPLNSLKPHPANARRGNRDVLAESLTELGQYRTIVVQKSTRFIIAGNNTWKTMKALGHKTVEVDVVDVDDREALQILLMDNAAADAGHTDHGAAVAMLNTLPDLKATGYTVEDITLPPIDLLADFMAEPEPEPPPETPEDAGPKPTLMQVGDAKGYMDPAEFKKWRATLPKRKTEAVTEMLERLGLWEPVEEQEEATKSPITGREQYPIDLLIPMPGNPRQGDMGKLMGSLQEHGQYRSIVVNRHNCHILVGNNLAKAAKKLGYTRLSVRWVEVDAETEKRIVLMDNRSNELASMDLDALGQAIASLGSVQGTGYDLEDLNRILNGQNLVPAPRQASTDWVKIGNLKAKVRSDLIRGMGLVGGRELIEVAQLLGIDPNKVFPLT